MRGFGLTLLVSILVSMNALAQESPRVIQFTGVIFANDSASVIPGVHVYVPKGGRGTTTNPYGFFSMPAVEGDSIVFSAIGFERTSYVVPKHDADHSLRVLVYLQEDVLYLEEVAVFPYPSEATFKAAVLASQVPGQHINNMSVWTNPEIMRTLYSQLPNSGNANFRYFMDQQMNYNRYQYQPAANNYLNPFAWRSFIRSLKKD